jgi:hypothetical protein
MPEDGKDPQVVNNLDSAAPHTDGAGSVCGNYDLQIFIAK